MGRHEACCLPDGDILFIDAARWVGCWYTQVGTMYRCRPDGSDMQCVSANIEHDNTPAVLPDGRILYAMGYIDRSGGVPPLDNEPGWHRR